MSNLKFYIGQKAVFFVGNDHMFDGTVGTITAWEKKPEGNFFKLQPSEGDARTWHENCLITYQEWQQKIVSGEAKEAIDRDTYTRRRIRGNGYSSVNLKPLSEWELDTIKGVTSGQRPARLERMAELFKQNMPTNFYFKVVSPLKETKPGLTENATLEEIFQFVDQVLDGDYEYKRSLKLKTELLVESWKLKPYEALTNTLYETAGDPAPYPYDRDNPPA